MQNVRDSDTTEDQQRATRTNNDRCRFQDPPVPHVCHNAQKKTRKTIKSSAAHSAGTSTLDIPLLFMLEITAARNSATPYPGFGLLAMQRVILLFHLACHTLQAELVD